MGLVTNYLKKKRQESESVSQPTEVLKTTDFNNESRQQEDFSNIKLEGFKFEEPLRKVQSSEGALLGEGTTLGQGVKLDVETPKIKYEENLFKKQKELVEEFKNVGQPFLDKLGTDDKDLLIDGLQKEKDRKEIIRAYTPEDANNIQIENNQADIERERLKILGLEDKSPYLTEQFRAGGRSGLTFGYDKELQELFGVPTQEPGTPQTIGEEVSKGLGELFGTVVNPITWGIFGGASKLVSKGLGATGRTLAGTTAENAIGVGTISGLWNTGEEIGSSEDLKKRATNTVEGFIGGAILGASIGLIGGGINLLRGKEFRLTPGLGVKYGPTESSASLIDKRLKIQNLISNEAATLGEKTAAQGQLSKIDARLKEEGKSILQFTKYVPETDSYIIKAEGIDDFFEINGANPNQTRIWSKEGFKKMDIEVLENGSIKINTSEWIPENLSKKIGTITANKLPKLIAETSITPTLDTPVTPKEFIIDNDFRSLSEIIAKEKVPTESGIVPKDVIEALNKSEIIEENKIPEQSEYVPGDNITYKEAEAAHRGTSFSSETRAKSEIESHKKELQQTYDELSKLADTSEKKSLLLEEMKRFEEKYTQLKKESLASRSNIVSSMIAGPARFPVARMQKRQGFYEKKVNTMIEYKEKAISSIKKKLNNIDIQEKGGPIEVLKNEIAILKKKQELAKANNIKVRKEGKGELVPGFSLTNLNNRIKDREAKLLKMEKLEIAKESGVESKELQKFEGGSIIENIQADRLQIKFDGKPSLNIITELKRNGYRWSPTNGVWQRQLTNNAKYSLRFLDFLKNDNIKPQITEEGQIGNDLGIQKAGLGKVDDLVSEAKKYKSAEEFVNKNLEVDTLLPSNRPMGEKTLADLKYTGSKANTQKVKVSPIEDVINRAKQVVDSGGDGSVGNYEVYDVLKKVKNGRIKVYHGTSEAGANTIGSGWAGLNDGSYLSLTKGAEKEAMGVYGAKYYADIASKYGKGGQVLEFEIPLKNVAIDKTTGELRYVSDKTKSQLTDIWNEANKATPEQSLIQEAKKYKSAEEFVKAQADDYVKSTKEYKDWAKGSNNIIEAYHGTPYSFDKFEIGKKQAGAYELESISFATKKELAEPFSRQYPDWYYPKLKELKSRFPNIDEIESKAKLIDNNKKLRSVESIKKEGQQWVDNLNNEWEKDKDWLYNNNYEKFKQRRAGTFKIIKELQNELTRSKNYIKPTVSKQESQILANYNKELQKLEDSVQGNIYKVHIKGNKIIDEIGEDIGFSSQRNGIVAELKGDILRIKDADTGQYIGEEIIVNDPSQVFIVNSPKTKSQLTDIWNKANQSKGIKPGLGKVDDLVSEAKKYKSVEEFINAQGEPLYHGTNANFIDFNLEKSGQGAGKNAHGKGVYITDTIQIGERYKNEMGGKNLYKVYIPKNLKIFDGKVTQSELNKIQKIVNTDLSDKIIQAKKNGWVNIYDNLLNSGELSKLSELYDGIKFLDTAQYGSIYGYSYNIFNPKNVKTMEGLKQIYNQSKGIKPQEIRSYQKEIAQKYGAESGIKETDLYSSIKEIKDLYPKAEIEVVDNIKDLIGIKANGYFDAETGKIVISEDSAIKTTVWHETTHRALQNLKETDIARFKEIETDAKKQYGDDWEEFLAEETFYKNEEGKFKTEGLLQSIKDFINNIIDKIKGLFKDDPLKKFYDDLLSGKIEEPKTEFGKSLKFQLAEEEPILSEIYNKTFIKKESKIKKYTDSLLETLEKALVPIDTVIGDIDEGLKNKIKRFEFEILNSDIIQNAKPILKDITTKIKGKKDSDDYRILNIALKNNDLGVIDYYASKLGISKELKEYKGILDDIFNKAKEVGMDIGYLENYFPRVVRDSRGLLNTVYGSEYGSLIRDAIKLEELKRGELTEEEKAGIIDKMLRGYVQNGISLTAPGNVKERTIDEVNSSLNDFYYDSIDGLSIYTQSMNDNIEARKLFGKGENLQDSIGRYTLNLLTEGKITPEEELKLTRVLKARFTTKKMDAAIQAYKNLSYLTTMGNPVSTLTQIQDLAFALYENGFLLTGQELGKAIIGKSKITKEDLGISSMVQEFNEPSMLQNAVSKVFKMVGLDKMDSLGKETLINGYYQKLKKQVLSEDFSGLEILDKQDIPNAILALQNNMVNDDIQYLLFSKLLDYQPITKSQLPEYYNTSGNMRILYMLKTYSIKQIDTFRREVFNKISDGVKNKDKKSFKEGFKNLVFLTTSLTLLGMGVDALKDTLLNRKTEVSDLMVDNMFKLMGFSKYTIYKAKQEGVSSALLSLVVPPFNIINDPVKDLVSIFTENQTTGESNFKGIGKMQSIGDIPIGGKLYYWWFGKGTQSKQSEEYKPKSVKSRLLKSRSNSTERIKVKRK